MAGAGALALAPAAPAASSALAPPGARLCAGQVCCLLSRLTGRPLEIREYGDAKHALAEAPAGYDVLAGVAVVPAASLFVVEIRKDGNLGFRSVGAAGRMLQATPRRGECHRAANHNFGGWESWFAAEDGTLVNVAHPHKQLAATVALVPGALTLSDLRALENTHARLERDARLRLKAVEDRCSVEQRRVRELETQLGTMGAEEDAKREVLRVRVRELEAALAASDRKLNDAKAAARHREAKAAAAAADAEDARCLLHEAQREAAALREQASALTEEREAMTASLIHTKEAAVRALRCISTPKKSSPSARSPERVAPSKGKGTERRTPSTVLLDAFNSPDSPVSPPQLLHTRRALSDSQEQREEYDHDATARVLLASGSPTAAAKAATMTRDSSASTLVPDSEEGDSSPGGGKGKPSAAKSIFGKSVSDVGRAAVVSAAAAVATDDFGTRSAADEIALARAMVSAGSSQRRPSPAEAAAADIALAKTAQPARPVKQLNELCTHMLTDLRGATWDEDPLLASSKSSDGSFERTPSDGDAKANERRAPTQGATVAAKPSSAVIDKQGAPSRTGAPGGVGHAPASRATAPQQSTADALWDVDPGQFCFHVSR